MTNNYGNRLEIKLKVLNQLIREVDVKYNGNDNNFLEKYIDESISNFKEATDVKIAEALECFRNLRDRPKSFIAHWSHKHTG